MPSKKWVRRVSSRRGGRDFAQQFPDMAGITGKSFLISFLSTLVARQLSLRFRGDRGSCDWRHFGRLAGFTNQKENYGLINGLQPFVKLRCCKGQVYFGAAEFLRQVEVLKRAIISQRESGKRAQSRSTNTPVSPLFRSI